MKISNHSQNQWLRRCTVSALLLVSGCGGLRLGDPLRIDEADWAIFGKTPSRSNATQETITPPLRIAWEYDITSGMGYGSPLVIDSVVIATNLRGEMYCINANTGKRFGWVALGDAIHGSPVIDGNIAYVAVTNSRETFIAYDLFDGKALWKQEFGDLEVTPLLLQNKLYFGNTSGTFFCVDKEKGEIDWRFKLPENTAFKGIRSAATTNDSLVFFGAEDGSLYALDGKYGSEQWSYNTGASIFASPAVRNGVVYCGNNAGTMYALDASDGRVRWRAHIGGSIYATPSFTDNFLLIGTTAGTLHALNLSDGSPAWKTEFSSVINSSAVVSGNFAYVGTLKKEFCAVRVDDGTVIWTHTLPGRIKTSPAIAHGKIFVATDDKLILAFKESETN